ncbi:PAS domain-containing protein [Pedobacter sp.]|jgi:PAS domain-containing protein|uniref:PAS domain-containing protein n=1 Tax=Pedobacter sp. TaxID=1411316 RepID=UPI002D7EE6BB|nr:PAS domain-containing protein [Pedobacter sp.]
MIPKDRFLSDQALLDIMRLSQDATAIYCSEELHINFVNNAMLAFWNKDSSVMGTRLEDAVPELRVQPFIELLKEVWRTGKTFEATGMPAELMSGGEMQTFYFDFVYRAILNENGETYCILHTASEVTERIRNSKIIEYKRQKNEVLNEQLNQMNVELLAVNEELSDANEKLLTAKNELQRANFRLFENENRLRTITQQVPVGLCVVKGREMLIEVANDSMLKLWGLSKLEVLNRPYQFVRPGRDWEQVSEQLLEVYTSGKTKLEHEIVYQPLFDFSGYVDGVIIIKYRFEGLVTQEIHD